MSSTSSPIVGLSVQDHGDGGDRMLSEISAALKEINNTAKGCFMEKHIQDVTSLCFDVYKSIHNREDVGLFMDDMANLDLVNEFWKLTTTFSKILAVFLKRLNAGIWGFFTDIKKETESIVVATKRGLLFLGRIKEHITGLWNFFSKTKFLELLGLQSRKPGHEKSEEVDRGFLNCLLDISSMKFDAALKLSEDHKKQAQQYLESVSSNLDFAFKYGKDTARSVFDLIVNSISSTYYAVKWASNKAVVARTFPGKPRSTGSVGSAVSDIASRVWGTFTSFLDSSSSYMSTQKEEYRLAVTTKYAENRKAVYEETSEKIVLVEIEELKKLEPRVQTQFRYQAKAYVDFCASIRSIVVAADGKIKDPVAADKVQQLLECTRSALLKGAEDGYAKMRIEDFSDKSDAIFKEAADAVNNYFGNASRLNKKGDSQMESIESQLSMQAARFLAERVDAIGRDRKSAIVKDENAAKEIDFNIY